MVDLRIAAKYNTCNNPQTPPGFYESVSRNIWVNELKSKMDKTIFGESYVPCFIFSVIMPEDVSKITPGSGNMICMFVCMEF